MIKIPIRARPLGIGLASLVLLVPALYFAKPVLLPIILSTFITLLFSPLVNFLELKRIPRQVSVISLLLVLVMGIGLGVSALSEPVQEWWAELPKVVKDVSQEVSEATKSSTQELQKELDIAKNIDGLGHTTVFSFVKSFASTTPSILTQLMIILFMVYFMLNYGRDLFRQTITHLGNFGNKRRAVELVKTVQQDLSRYIGTITLVNAGLGLTVGVVFFFLGFEDPFVWGAFAGLMNFAPYLGPFISMCCFALVSYLQLDSISFTAIVVSSYLFMNLIESQFVTPTMLGKRFNLNPLIIFIWLVIWGFLWGGMGLLIGVPLLVCLNILFDRFELV